MEPSILPTKASAAPGAPVPLPLPTENQRPPGTAKEPLSLNSAIGHLDLRTPEEEIEFQECESMVRAGCAHFAEVGDALIRIRDKKLYRNEYHSFQLYCEERWGFGHSKAWGYIAAAQIRHMLGSIPGIPLPECEAQVRPLVGVSAEVAQQAWLHALSRSPNSHVPARVVKRALKQVLKAEQPAIPAESKANRQQPYRLRQSVRTGFQELLTLLLGNAERAVLIAKVQEIQRLLDPILNPKKTKA